MANIAGLPSSPGITIAGISFPDVKNLIILHAHAVGASRYCTFRIPTSGAGYQVTAGKTLTIYAMTFISEGTAPAPLIYYQDADTSWQSTTAPTNASYICGQSSAPPFTVTATAGSKNEYVTKWSIPQNKYLGVDMGGTAGAGVTLYGYEA